ncbi:MAG: low molecular weight phosphotyrosine protein phosphatase [bacterium]|nr:low molecular weight phosphotyrosine protein phosphatase [bacterium]
MNKKINVLFVCLGNICRSPAAEILFNNHIKGLGKESMFYVDSCGTGGWHEGEKADKRMRQTAEASGLEILHRARQIKSLDFDQFDYILAMDDKNILDLKVMSEKNAEKIFLLSDLSTDYLSQNIPDPYFGDMKGFENVFNLLDKVTKQVANTILYKHSKKLQS